MNFKKYFGTDGIRGIVGNYPITPEFFLKLGWVIGKVLGNQGSKKIVIGSDTRISSFTLISAIEAGISSAGISTYFLGVIPTPAVAYLTKLFFAEAGIVISASHNPYYYNGIKFFSIYGTKINDDLEKKIEKKMQRKINCVSSIKLGKSTKIIKASELYINFCKKSVYDNLNLKRLKIVLDCANGSTYKIGPIILNQLGANLIILNCKPNGININKNCGTDKINNLKSKVLTEKADLGIAFDGDGDRVIMIDHLGNTVNGDYILYILAKENITSKKKYYGVVGTIMSNLGLEIALKKIGIAFVRSKVGDRYILEKLKEKKWIFGAENSGHIILLNKTTTGDGIIASLQILSIMIKKNLSLYDLCKNIVFFPQILLNIKLNKKINPLKDTKVKKVIKNISEKLKNNGRIMIRKSGTEPLIRIMIEGKNKKKIFNLSKDISNAINKI